MTDESTEIAVVEHDVGGLVQHDPTAALENTEKLVRYMAEKCTGPRFISNIQGRSYPRVEWWTTVGLALGLQPVEVSSKKIEFEGGYMYEAIVEVRRDGKVITRASAICSTEERSWGSRDEYAVKSMAGTRATGKAYRIGLSALAVMAGLEPTPADEVPPQGFSNARRATVQKPVVSQANQEALDALNSLYGAGSEYREQRIAYIKDVLSPKEINHPKEVTDEEWVKVKESAVGDLAAMESGAPPEEPDYEAPDGKLAMFGDEPVVKDH